jgi:Na+/phosphate symporter
MKMLKNSIKSFLLLWKWWGLITIFIIFLLVHSHIKSHLKHQQDEIKQLESALTATQKKINYYQNNLEKNAITKTDLLTKSQLINFIKNSVENAPKIEVRNIALSKQKKSVKDIFFGISSDELINVSILTLRLSLSGNYLDVMTLLKAFNKINAVVLYNQLNFKINEYPNAQTDITLVIPIIKS